MASLPLRFESKIERLGSGCWEWTGCRIWNGYGRIHMTIEGKRHMLLAHRAVYELLIGPIPSGMTLDHICRNRLCVNPEHLEPVTMRENALRGVGPTAINARKIFCIRGHLITGSNLDGTRYCKVCTNIQKRKYYKQHRNSGPRSPQSHCSRGHAFTAENTILHGGAQHCRTCARERMRKFKEKRNAKA